MIPDILMSLVTSSDASSLQKVFDSKISTQNLLPVELGTIKDIMKFVNLYKEVWLFALKHKNCTKGDVPGESKDESLLPGLYLQAFSEGIELVVKSFHEFVLELEVKFLKKPDHSLMFISTELERFRPLFEFLHSLINGIKTQKLHGCGILQYLEYNLLHGDQKIVRAVKRIQNEVYIVFIHHLCQWMIYGKIMDQFNEFFIQHVENNKQVKDSVYSTSTFTSSETTSISDLWHFEINYDLFPNYFSRKWAEKVMFIGQTVVMFNSDPRDMIKNKLWSSECSEILNFDKEVSRKKQSIWGDQEYLFYRKFHELQTNRKLEVEHFEQVVDEIKICVSEHLSDIAINEADLIKNLKIIKDFYLLGRGELFYEFIKGLSINYAKPLTEASVRDINRAFQVAACSVNISDDIDLFCFHLNKEEIDSFNYENRGFINHITLKYKVRWPLHLIFTPKILERYNELFRFLLKIKRTQYTLQIIWCHQRETKVERNSKLLQFRNKLMFLIDNLQYYLQVDVLESQFCIMMAKIEGSMDFEEIQRAHSIFQANILSLCFLLETTEQSRSDSQIVIENPVLTSLNKIIHLVENFSMFTFSCSTPLNELDQQTFANFEPMFDVEVASLLKKVSQMNVGPSNAPLSQFLLRLDFNHWFSKNIKMDEDS